MWRSHHRITKSQIYRILEYPEQEGTPKDPRVQLLAPHLLLHPPRHSTEPCASHGAGELRTG